MSKNTDYLSYIKTVFAISGYLPTQKSLKTQIFKFILTPAMSVLFFLIIYDLRYMHQNIFEIASVFESLSSHGHVFGRKLSILKHASLLEELINDRRNFWSYDLFGEKLERLFQQKMSLRNSIIKSLTGISVVMLLYFYLTPIFASVDLPQACWIPGFVSKKVIYFFQVVCLFESLTVAVVIDGTLLLMCGEMEIQFVLLKKTLSSVKMGRNCSQKHEFFCLDKLKFCASYHSFLLKEHDKMKKCFSEFFLLQFLLSIEGLCIELFVLNEAKTWSQLALAIIYIVGIIMQSSFTFLSASNLENKAETLIHDLYGIDWYNATDSKIPKHLIFMLMKAQRPLRFKGAGLFDVNRNALLQIMKTGFSISALIRQV